MTLSAEKFIHRFLLHALPNGFHRIRYYGFRLATATDKKNWRLCRQLLGMALPESAPTAI